MGNPAAALRLLALAAASLGSASLGCASLGASRSPPRTPPAVLARAGTFVYHRPAPEVRAAVQAELSAEGYTVSPESGDGLLRTDWKMLIDGREFATFRDRYVVLVKRLTDHHCRVEAVRITMSTLGADTGHPLKMFVPADVNSKTNSYSIFGEGLARPAVPRGIERDLAFEWRLLARVEPSAAGRIAAAPARR